MHRKHFIQYAFLSIFFLADLMACTFPGGKPLPPEPTSINDAPATNAPPGDSATVVAVPTQPPPTLTPVPFNPLSVRAADCNYGGAVKAIEALDAYTVRFEFCQPQIAFLSKIAFPSFGIQPQEWLEQTAGGGQGSLLLEKPVGAGPYQFVSWKRGEKITLQAFENYWSPRKPAIKNLVFRWEPDDALRLLDLQAGAVNGIDNLGNIDFYAVQSDLSLQFFLRAAQRGLSGDEQPVCALR